MKKILISGLNPAWQKTLFFSALKWGEVNRAVHAERTASGKGINVARAAKLWGKAEGIVLQFAGGVTGKLLTDVLDQEQINHLTTVCEARTRVCTTVISETPHSVTELIEPSEKIPQWASDKLFTAGTDALKTADALAVCGTYPPGVSPDFYAKLIREARRQQKFVLLDSFMNVEESLHAGVSLLKVNLEEICKLTGKTEIISAIQTCIDRYALKMIAVTAGPDHAYFFNGSELYQLAPPKISRVENTIGAGDTCSSVLLSEIVCGNDPMEAFLLGLSAASASCMTDSCAFYDRNTALKLRGEASMPEQIKTF